MGWAFVLIIVGIIGALDALVVLMFPKAIRKFTLRIAKNPKKLKKVASIELIIALIFLLLGIVLMN